MSLPAQETAPADAGQGPAPEAPATTPEPVNTGTETTGDPNAEVQPTPDAQAQPDGGQGLIASYLEGVDESARGTVAEVLERYRQDSDAKVTKRFEELNQFKSYLPEGAGVDYLDGPVGLYENLMDKPLETVEWIFGQFKDAGIDLKAQLLGGEQAPATEEAAPPADPSTDPDRPLTYADWQRIQEEQRQQEAQAQDQATRRTTVEGWFKEATEAKGLELGPEDVAVKQAVLQHAAQLLPTFKQYGDQAGKHALETAVEAFVNRFGKPTPGKADPTNPEPKIADGGTPPAPSTPDLTDQKTRRAHMLARLTSSPNAQE